MRLLDHEKHYEQLKIHFWVISLHQLVTGHGMLFHFRSSFHSCQSQEKSFVALLIPFSLSYLFFKRIEQLLPILPNSAGGVIDCPCVKSIWMHTSWASCHCERIQSKNQLLTHVKGWVGKVWPSTLRERETASWAVFFAFYISLLNFSQEKSFHLDRVDRHKWKTSGSDELDREPRAALVTSWQTVTNTL